MRVPPDLVELAKSYSGKWVALHPDDGSVVAAGQSPREVMEVAEADGIDEPFVLHVFDDYGQLARPRPQLDGESLVPAPPVCRG